MANSRMNVLLWLRKRFDAFDKQWILRSDAKITSFSMFTLLQQLVTNHSNSYAKALPASRMTPSAFSKQRRCFDHALLKEVYVDLYQQVPSVQATPTTMQFIAVDGSTLLLKRPPDSKGL